ncbi:MAG: nucleoside 2-deoxyribosyltransferase domain-containing protein [Candidatus Latescibacteria bacterium]|nr:nucleoside 2-deoxyribosyltransferase domain-containing protein [Candidatus Latescibacterota bacterium]
MLIYFAGPLFSESEKRYNQRLTDRLEAIGYRVFLPQRDGIELNEPPHDQQTKDERRGAIFQLDVSKVLEADVFLFVLDGRVPDEGACVELGVAYCQKALQNRKKLLIGLHTDVRAIFLDSKLNPMLSVPLEYIAENEDELVRMLKQYKEAGTLD